MYRSHQLADAILSDGDVEHEDASSIHLDDTRSRLLFDRDGEGATHERQFLVGNDEDEEPEGLEDEVQSFRSSVSMDTEQERAKIGSFMNNSSARMSHLDVHQGSSRALDEDGDGEVPKEKKGGSLAAKAGIILVCVRSISRCTQD